MEPAFTTSSSPTRYHRHAETTFGRIADPEEASRRWLPSSRPPRGVEIKTKPHAVVTPPLAHSSSTRSTRSTVRWLRKGFSHTFFASATLKSFQRTLALSRSIEVSRLIVAGTAAQSSRVSARLLPLLLPERVASSSSELRQLKRAVSQKRAAFEGSAQHDAPTSSCEGLLNRIEGWVGRFLRKGIINLPQWKVRAAPWTRPAGGHFFFLPEV